MIDYTEEVKKIISKQFGIAEDHLEEESTLADLGLTELEIEDIVSTLETKYDIKIPAEKISSFKKISDITSYLYENIETAL